MRRTATALLAGGLLVCSAAEPPVTIDIDGPTAIGFFPPVTRKEMDEDDGTLSDGVTHLRFALEDVEKCLAPLKLALVFEHARSLVLKDGRTSHHLEFGKDWQHSIGIVLVAPGRAPAITYATPGPSLLQETAPQAAWKYFSEPKCKRYEEPDAA